MLAAFVEGLQPTDSLDELKRRLIDALTRFGARYIDYRAYEIGENGEPHGSFSFSTMPPAWVERYLSQKFYLVDPVFREMRARRAPVVWSDVSSRQDLSEPQRNLFEEARSFGIGDGLCIPIFESDSFGLVAMAMPDFDPATTDAVRRGIPLLQAISHVFHTYVADARHPEWAARVMRPLSPREREVMQWVAAGKTDWEVSTILHISERSVKFHVAGARRKLFAANRTHAVAKAVALHLIDLG